MTISGKLYSYINVSPWRNLYDKMIVWQLIPLLFVATVYASAFDIKSKNMEVIPAVSAAVIDSQKLERVDKVKEIVPYGSMKLAVKVNDTENEDEQIFAFRELVNFINFICEKALQREDKRTFADNWIGAIFELAKEAYAKQVYEEDSIPDSDDEFDRVTLKKGAEAFDYHDTLKYKDYQDILFSSEGESDASAVLTSNYSGIVADLDDEIDLFALIKSKMVKEEVSDDGKEDWQSDNLSVYSDCKGEIVEHKPSDDEDEDGSRQNIIRESLRTIKAKGRRRNPGGMMGSILNAENLNVAADFMTSSMTMDSKTEVNYDNYSGNGQIASIEEITGHVPRVIDSAAMMEQMQQQIMEQIMAQLAQSNPQLAQYGAMFQDEQAKFEAAMDPDGDGKMEISKEGVVQLLKTSAIPKLLNSAIKGKTGIDVLRTLSMILRSLNEGLGIFEVILKILLRVTRAVRYYSLCIADVVYEMAREDNLRPIVDLSVPMDSIPMRKKSGGKMRKLTSMFGRKCKNAGADGSEAEVEMSPFTMGIHAALSKARDYTAELQKLPPVLLLRLIHTIFAELDKRNGIIRVALARKQHKTLIGMQDEINSAVDHIFQAILATDEEAYAFLHSVTPTMITEILISLISPVKMEPARIEKHVAEVTTWIKPLMVLMNQESQISMLNYLLTDPEVECSFRKSQGVSEAKKAKFKKFSWTSSRSKK